MSGKRKTHSPEFKAKVALEALKEIATTSQLTSRYHIHATQISQWKRDAKEGLPEIFRKGKNQRAKTEEELTAPLYEEIGRLKVELDWLKKKLPSSATNRQLLIEADDPIMSIARQCDLLGIARSSYYYRPATESSENLRYMRLIDEQYLKTPFYGYRRMTNWLQRETKDTVNHKRILRLMKIMNLKSVLPGPHTSKPHPEHKIYPYLLGGMTLSQPNLVWSTDITYIPMQRGFMYLVAVIDWYSRYVLSWRISNTLDVGFCVDAMNEALEHGEPVIFNTDQGSQFTSEAFTKILLQRQILISMDGRGRALDNVFIERLWWSVKYEEIYINEYNGVIQLHDSLRKYFKFYNLERPHSSLGNKVPSEVHGFSHNDRDAGLCIKNETL